jgi:hypothetical protein
MANVKDVFPSKYLSAADIAGREPTVTFSAVEVIEMEQDNRVQRKLVASFKNATKQLVLNKTNSQACADLYGDDTDAWIGKAVKLVVARVDFQGRRVDAIRIDPPARATGSAPAPTAQPPRGHPADLDDEIPFAPSFL